MRKKIVTSILAITFLCLKAQSQMNDDNYAKSIYGKGEELTSCESNFVNLLINWPEWVSNHEDCQIVSCRFVEAIHDETFLKKYERIVSERNALVRTYVNNKFSIKDFGDSTESSKTMDVYIVSGDSAFNNMKLAVFGENSLWTERDIYFMLLKDVYTKSVKIGDKVYELTLIVKGQKYKNYVFCRPQTNKVIFDKLFYDLHRSEK